MKRTITAPEVLTIEVVGEKPVDGVFEAELEDPGVLIGFTTFELAVRRASAPEKVAVVAVAYTVVTLACMAVYGVEAWIGRGEGFAVYFDLFSRMAPFGCEGNHIVRCGRSSGCWA